MNEAPLGLFLTWTLYGTFLPGDARGWRHRRDGQRVGQPDLESWHRSRLTHDILLLDEPMRAVTTSALQEICRFRSWTAWAISVRTNHVHVVVSAANYKPTLVRDQLKAKATREIRSLFPVFIDRPVWGRGGDIQFLDHVDEIEQCVMYVHEAQNRKKNDPREP